MVIFQSTLELLWNVGAVKKFQYGCLHTISTVSSAGEVIEVKDTEQTHFRRSNSSLLLSGYGGSLMCHKASTVFQGNQRIPLGVEKILLKYPIDVRIGYLTFDKNWFDQWYLWLLSSNIVTKLTFVTYMKIVTSVTFATYVEIWSMWLLWQGKSVIHLNIVINVTIVITVTFVTCEDCY